MLLDITMLLLLNHHSDVLRRNTVRLNSLKKASVGAKVHRID